MPIDMDRFADPVVGPGPVDPIKLFRSLDVSDPMIQDLWLAQGDALREWHKVRDSKDSAIVLNTGAGKTLVGLLAAHSLVNEGLSSVIYACSSIQLVRQTAEKAEGYGLPVTTYYGGRFSNHLYSSGQAACVTLYQALFNGLSVFQDDSNIKAIIFDDAHTAGHLLRDHYTLRIDSRTNADLYSRITQLFRAYFASINQEVGYQETIDGADRSVVRFVPPFAVLEVFGTMRELLMDSELSETTSTKFAWQHLRDHLDLCAVFVTNKEVSFTPPVIPTGSLNYFREGVRRIYLSATLNSKEGFVRTFGRVPDPIIAPETTVGNCERLILFPRLTKGGMKLDDVETAKDVLVDRKSLVLVPTRYRKAKWDDVESEFKGEVASWVEEFKAMQPPACLVLTARYDGVDLPGDTCRLMVIDDLPTGLNPLERYLWEELQVGRLLKTTLASRIVQSFGRISRGMNDHGVVLLTGDRLLEWILAPANRALLPEFLQCQLLTGKLFSERINWDELEEAVAKCLERDEVWTETYKRLMDLYSGHTVKPSENDESLSIALAEVRFGELLWNREYEKALRALYLTIDDTFSVSRATGAWHSLWIAYCYQLLGDQDAAFEMYRRAKSGDHRIPAPLTLSEVAGREISEQASAVASLLLSRRGTSLDVPRLFDHQLVYIDGTATARPTENSLHSLGIYLGLCSTRPDNEFSTGPDVLWEDSTGKALSMELKTDKHPTQSTYTKEDLGQLLDHKQWVIDNRGSTQILSTFVGPTRPASASSNPSDEAFVLELTHFEGLRDRLRTALHDVCANATPVNVASVIQKTFEERGLTFNQIMEQLPIRKVKDIT